jgi:hypothetical protein
LGWHPVAVEQYTFTHKTIHRRENILPLPVFATRPAQLVAGLCAKYNMPIHVIVIIIIIIVSIIIIIRLSSSSGRPFQ